MIQKSWKCKSSENKNFPKSKDNITIVCFLFQYCQLMYKQNIACLTTYYYAVNIVPNSFIYPTDGMLQSLWTIPLLLYFLFYFPAIDKEVKSFDSVAFLFRR